MPTPAPASSLPAQSDTTPSAVSAAPDLFGASSVPVKDGVSPAPVFVQPEIPDAQVGYKKFVPAWKNDFKWLTYSYRQNHMQCELCIKHKQSTVFVTGCSNFRRKTLVRHEQGEAHKNAVSAEKNHKLKDLNPQRELAFRCALETAYFCASEEIANRKYK